MLQPIAQTMQELSVAEVQQVAGGALRRLPTRLAAPLPPAPRK